MNNNNTTYPSIISIDHESGSSGESLRIFNSSYNTYSPHSNSYSDYTIPSKLEALDYNYWPATTTHNILTNPTTTTVLDHIQSSSPPSSSQTIETLVPISSVHLSQMHSSATISSTHHYHRIHQHLCPSSSSPPPPPPGCHDPSTWLGSGDYQPLHSTTNSSSYRHYSTPCSFYSPNNFYDPSQSHWTPPQLPSSSMLPIKFESPYSPPPSYYQSTDSLNHCHEQISKQEPIDSSPQQSNWIKHQSSSTQLSPIPPKNPLTGKTRTRDKYRIVYTDQQRYELENEFIISKYISIPRKSALSLTLSLSERQIKIWFQNRRAKERKLNKKQQEISTTRQLNNSNDGDSASDGGIESPNYYQNYT